MTTAFRNNVKPSRPSFRPPVPTAEVPEPDASLPPTQRAQALHTAAAQQYSDWRAAHSPDIDADVLKQSAGAFAAAPVITKQLPAALAAVVADADQAQQRVRDTLNSATVKPEDEARASRVWARAVRLLDSKPSPPEVSAALGIWLLTRIPPTWRSTVKNCPPTWNRGTRRVIGWIPHWPRRSPALPTPFPNPN